MGEDGLGSPGATLGGVELPPVSTLDLDGPIAYRRWEGDPETTFLLLHGLGASNLTWVQVGPSLAGLGTVIARPPGLRRVPDRRAEASA